MLSLISVKCPHCGARGQIMVPPIGSIIVGPCPECHELVVIFNGAVLPLDKEIMVRGDEEQRCNHLMQALATYLEARIAQVVDELTHTDDDEETVGREVGEPELEDMAEPELALVEAPEDTITEDELNQFINVDLKLLDNPDYFKAIFD
uniref:Myosin heavy chain n=1 Tax=uncultured bacterium FLS12 TaxID=651659 RepID=C5HLB5_9BACT|nr:myosin heavy chain [uncultured bacterium FLS12]